MDADEKPSTPQSKESHENIEPNPRTEDNRTPVSVHGQPPNSHGVLATGEPRVEEAQSSADQPDNPPPYSVFSLWEKRMIVLGASFSAFFSPLSAQIYLPALPALASDFHVSAGQINLTVTTYMIFQGITPMFIGGFADSAGRRPAFLLCFVVYIAANIGLALSRNYASVLVVRCLQSAGSSTTVALCQAVVADIITSAERGSYIGITVIPIILAPSLGPVLGGVFSQYLGWRSIFWFLTIIAAITLLLLLLFFPETCRRIVGDGSEIPHPAYRTLWQMIQISRRKHAAHRAKQISGIRRTASAVSSTVADRKQQGFHLASPDVLGSLKLLLEPELALLLFYSSVVFAGFYAIATAMPAQLQSIYGLSDLQVGLMYLPMAGGSIVVAFVMGPALDRNYKRHAAKLGLPTSKAERGRQTDLTKFPIEHARLEVGFPLLAVNTAATICWGWAMRPSAGLAPLCVLLFIIGISMVGFNNAINALVIDIHSGHAGAAVAANNLTRCLIGAAASALIVPMINAMGSGWAFTFVGLLFVLFAPALLLVMKRGIEWRAKAKAKDEKKEVKKQERNRVKNEESSGDHHGEGIVSTELRDVEKEPDV